MGFYKKTNTQGTAKLFYKRFLYDEFMKDLEQKPLVDFYLGEKYLFGRIDHFSTPIVLKDPASMKPLKGPAEPSLRPKAVNFVADAFQAFSEDFQRCLLKGQINPSDKYLSDIKVFKAYESPYVHYETYRKGFMGTIQSSIRKDNVLFKDLEEFAYIFIDILTRGEGVARYPFTSSAFIKSRLCPINVSGLVIEIADESFSNDDNKIEQFVKSPNFEFYMQACNNNGFMVDQAAPWRMVADIDTPVMRGRAAAYRGDAVSMSTSRLLSDYYVNEYSNCYNNFKKTLYELYNLTKPEAIPINNYCEDGSRVISYSYPVDYGGFRSFISAMSEEYFLEIYFKIRFYEEESQYAEEEKNKLTRELINYYRANRLSTTLFMFERILNKTFDYAGSMMYIIKRRKLIEEESQLSSDSVRGGY